MIKIEDFNSDIILDKKPYDNIFITFHTKLCLIQNHCALDSIKQMELLDFTEGLDIQYYLVLKNMMQFTIELDFSLVKKVALHVFSHNYAKMKVDSSDSLPL